MINAVMEESSLSLLGLPPFRRCYSYLPADGTLGRVVNHGIFTRGTSRDGSESHWIHVCVHLCLFKFSQLQTITMNDEWRTMMKNVFRRSLCQR